MKKTAALAAAALIALSACSSEQSAAPTSPSSPTANAPSAESPAPPPSESLTPQDQEGENVQTLPANKPFAYSPSPYSDGSEATDWKVTLTKTKCGLKSIPNGVSNPDWDGSDEIPSDLPAKPDPGNDFCIFYWSWENVGKIPGTPDQSGDIMIGDERHARDGEEEMMSWRVMGSELGVAYADKVNPKKSTESLDIYQVPEGVTPDAVWFPMETLMGESSILVSTS